MINKLLAWWKYHMAKRAYRSWLYTLTYKQLEELANTPIEKYEEVERRLMIETGALIDYGT